MQMQIESIQKNLNIKFEKVQSIQLEIERIEAIIKDKNKDWMLNGNVIIAEGVSVKAFLNKVNNGVSAAKQATESLNITIRILKDYFDNISANNVLLTKNDGIQLLEIIKQTNRRLGNLLENLEMLRGSVKVVKKLEYMAN